LASTNSVLARTPVFSAAGLVADNAQTLRPAFASGDRFDRWAAGTEVALRTSAYAAGYAMGGPVGATASVTVYNVSSDIGRPIGTLLGNRLSENQMFQRATDRWFGLQTNADRAAMYDQQIAAIRAARAQANR
jgi:hypothetical protein